MRLRHFVWIPAVALAASAFGQSRPVEATATLKNAQGAAVGKVTFASNTQRTAVVINAQLTGLPPGTHAMHIHTVGQCDPPGFTSAGGHFNPGMKQHGTENPQGHHAGDLPNFEVGANGSATVSVTVPGITLGDGPDSLFHPGGTALVIHANADDNKSDPAGNAGPRIACGVIEKAVK